MTNRQQLLNKQSNCNHGNFTCDSEQQGRKHPTKPGVQMLNSFMMVFTCGKCGKDVSFTVVNGQGKTVRVVF
jgi:hypothetical protein